MDGILQGIDTAWHVVLTGAFAMVPGLLVWSLVLGVALLVRRVRRIGIMAKSQRKGAVA